MIITRIAEVNKKKKKVLLEDDRSFVLYNSEIRRFHLEEGEDLSEQMYEEIVTNVLRKRGTIRALNLLLIQIRTRKELEERLRRDGYPEEVIEEACEYAERFHYLDDEEYARTYLAGRGSRKGSRVVAMELRSKGVEDSIIDEVLTERSSEEEFRLVQNLAEKKLGPIHPIDEGEFRRAWGYLARRGFTSDMISRVLRAYHSEE